MALHFAHAAAKSKLGSAAQAPASLSFCVPTASLPTLAVRDAERRSGRAPAEAQAAARKDSSAQWSRPVSRARCGLRVSGFRGL